MDAVAAYLYDNTAILLWALLIIMAILAFETSKGLHTLDPGVARMLDVIALCQMTLSPAGSDFYKDTGEGSKQMTVTFGGMSESKRKVQRDSRQTGLR